MLQDASDMPWFRGTAVAEALGYQDGKAALRQHVSKQRKKKRDALPPALAFPKCERETQWLSVQGVRDLVEGRGNEEGERFWRWLAEEVLPQVNSRGQEGTLNAEPQDPELATSEAVTEEVLASWKQDRRRKVLEYQLLQVQLARVAQKASEELGLPLPPTLQAEHLLREATTQEPGSQTAHTAEDLNRLCCATEWQDLQNTRLYKKLQRIDLALQARRMANECGLTVGDAQLLAERQAIEMAATPAHLDENGWLTAGETATIGWDSADAVLHDDPAAARVLQPA
jgi:prophage antirepressor-like protein